MPRDKSEQILQECRLLAEDSLVAQASQLHERVRRRRKGFWAKSFATPHSQEVVELASVWFTAYPSATICSNGYLPLQTLADPNLWKIFSEIGINAMHVGPVMSAGSVKVVDGRAEPLRPTSDGWFDPISLTVDPQIGTDEQYRAMVKAAAEHASAWVIGDVVPGHTGKGIDFRLAERAYRFYPGLYVMVRIDQRDWNLLPDNSLYEHDWESITLTPEQVQELSRREYLPGALQRSMADPKATSWSATAEIEGVHDRKRRWVYLHYFKEDQPTLNWFDPSCAAWRLIYGEIEQLFYNLNVKGIRLDANPFLGIERRRRIGVAAPNGVPDEEPLTHYAWSESHPMSWTVSNQLAWRARRLGGFSFQELNMSLGDIAQFSQWGPDLSYDFVTRPACEHALLTGDADLLRLSYQLMEQYKIDPLRLIHACQNHDELTYELVHFDVHRKDLFRLGGLQLTGGSLRRQIKSEMEQVALSGNNYNRRTGNGLCTTFAGLIAAALGVTSLDSFAGKERKALAERIRKGHLLLAAFNALQPGVFALSGWDLVGALPVDEQRFRPGFLGESGKEDYRWINRGGYDLMNVAAEKNETEFGIPRADCLYGGLPEQLRDEQSFVRQLSRLLQVRRDCRLHLGEFVGVLDAGSTSLFVTASAVRDAKGAGRRLLLTALNFSREKALRIDLDFGRWSSLWPERTGEITLIKAARRQMVDLLSGDMLHSPLEREVSPEIVVEPWSYRLIDTGAI